MITWANKSLKVEPKKIRLHFSFGLKTDTNKFPGMNSPIKFLPRLFFRLEELLFIAILLAAYNLGPQMLSLDSDLGRHITLGNYILSGTIPDSNILSYTKPNEPRPPYEWGSQVLIALANNYLELDGVIFLFAIIIAFSFSFIYQNSIKNNRTPVVSFLLTIIAIAASSIHWLPRPHVFTFLLLAVWTDQLQKARLSKTSSLLIFPILMVIWANLHGGFIFGLLAWLAYFAGVLWEKIAKVENDNLNLLRFARIGLCSIPATFITPDGWNNWKGVLGNNSIYILKNTQETNSPNFLLPEMWPFLLLLVLTIVILSLTRNKIHAGQGFLIAGMAVLSLSMVRNIPLFCIIAVPILSQAAKKILSRFQAWSGLEENMAVLQEKSVKGLWSTIFLVLICSNILLQRSNGITSANQFNSKIFPVAAVDWLEKNPQSGNIFNEFNWGGYLEMRLWPQLVFLDSQTDFYGEGLVREYQQVISADKNWEQIINKYDIQWLLIGRQSPLNVELGSNSKNWELLYSDNIAVIYRVK